MHIVYTTITVCILKLIVTKQKLVININVDWHYFVSELDNDKSLSFSVADDQEVASGGTDGSEEDLWSPSPAVPQSLCSTRIGWRTWVHMNTSVNE